MKLSSRQNRTQAHRRFGSDIPYNGISVWQEPDVSFLIDLSAGVDALNTFSMIYDGVNATNVTKEDKKPLPKKVRVILKKVSGSVLIVFFLGNLLNGKDR